MKCFWCGTAVATAQGKCECCGRDLAWSRIFRGVFRPVFGGRDNARANLEGAQATRRI